MHEIWPKVRYYQNKSLIDDSMYSVRNNIGYSKEHIDKIRREIFVITGHEELTNSLVELVKNGTVAISEDLSNNFIEEREVKVLDVDYEKVSKILYNEGGIQSFEGIVHDFNMDLPDSFLANSEEDYGIKRGLRFRIKLDVSGRFSLFFTIKRKLPTDKNVRIPTRDCLEMEFKIFNPESINHFAKELELTIEREKMKFRSSIILADEPFEFDKYPKLPGAEKSIPTIMETEIETSRIKLLGLLLKSLKLGNNKTSASGTRSLHEKNYGISKSCFNYDPDLQIERYDPIIAEMYKRKSIIHHLIKKK